MPTRTQAAADADAPWDLPSLGLALAAVVMYLSSELYLFSGRLGFPLDDSWIHLHFARQLAAGAGLTYNPESWVAGTTAPLWTALIALLIALPLPVVWSVKLLGGLLFLATVDATRRLALALGSSAGAARLAAVLVASTSWLVWSALSGMEVHLFTALSLWGLVLHLGERVSPHGPLYSLPVLALACLARPEGLLLLAAAIADRLLGFHSPRGGVKGLGRRLAEILPALGAAVLVVAPVFVVYRLAGDSFLPTTFAVKSPPRPDFLPNARHLRAVIDIFFRSQPVAFIFAGAGILRLAERWATPRGHGLLPTLWLLGLPFVNSLLAVDSGPSVVGNFGRYYFPLLPLVAVFAVLGWEGLARRLGRGFRVALVAAVLLPQLWGLLGGVPRYLQTIANVEDSDVAAALWLAEHLSPRSTGAALAVQDVGALKYFLPEHRTIDLTGITTPEILPVLRSENWQSELYAFLARQRPVCLVVFPEYYPGLVQAPGFRALRRFPVRDNVTMAGDELVIYTTPWAPPGLFLPPLREDE